MCSGISQECLTTRLEQTLIQNWRSLNYISYSRGGNLIVIFINVINSFCMVYVCMKYTSSISLILQIEKIVLFLLKQQGLIASRMAKIFEQQEALLKQPADAQQVAEIREAYREVGQDLLQLLYFLELNAIGLRKILKKFDKRLGYKFTNYYVETRANHPYSQLQQVFKHVVLRPDPQVFFST